MAAWPIMSSDWMKFQKSSSKTFCVMKLFHGKNFPQKNLLKKLYAFGGDLPNVCFLH